MRNARAVPLVRAAAVLAAAALASGCATAARKRAQAAREECRVAFRECAPPASFAPDTDVARLGIHELVTVAARLDVPDKLARAAAVRLETLAKTGDTATLLQIEGALEEAGAWSQRCRCRDFQSELAKADPGRIVAGRLPSREARTPEHWVDEILTRTDAIRALKRRQAEIVNAGDPSGASAMDGKVADAREDLCRTVKAARAPLSPDAFAELLGMVYEKQKAKAGEGSAEVTKRMLDEVKDSTCEAETQ